MIMEKNIDYYGQIAQGYNELHREEQEKKLAIIKEFIKPKKSDKLLDVGCGSGISSQWNCTITGIDPSNKLIDIAKKNYPKQTFLVGSAEKLPFEDKSFDIVISLTAIQNFDDIQKGLSEIKRVGKRTFALTFLKKSDKSKTILRLIEGIFDV